MASVMQGDAYNIPVTIKSGNGTLITPEIAACVEITVGQFTKRWPGQVTFDEKTGEWQFPVTQKQTFRFAPGAAVVQARVVFQDGSIMGGSGAPVRVEQSASRGTLPQPEKTEAATGSAPKATEVTIPTVHDIDVSLHSQVILSDPIKAPYIGDNGNWYEYDAATGTFVDTGTAASGTPPITPDTAGEYLTNDGSKAEWAKIEALPEGGVEGQVLTKKSNADGDAEWKNAVQSDWCEIDESSPSYIKNKLGGYYEADLNNRLGYGYYREDNGSYRDVLFPDIAEVNALDALYFKAKYLESQETITAFATFDELNDKNNEFGFYLEGRHIDDNGVSYGIYGASLTQIDFYATQTIPLRNEFIPLAGINIGGVKTKNSISSSNTNNYTPVTIDERGFLYSLKDTTYISTLSKDNMTSIVAAQGNLCVIQESPLLIEKMGLVAEDFPVLVANGKIDYNSTPRFNFLFVTQTGKSGTFTISPYEFIGYSITTPTSLGISGATTGKIAKIKAVDTEGKPTEWEQADLSESNLFLVHLIQGEPGSDGNPTYTVDKTFAEIKTAYDAGKKVELIPPAHDQNFFMSVGTVPFEVVNVNTKTIDFQSFSVSPVGIDLIPPWTLGGIPMGVIRVSISPDEKVLVDFPFSVGGDTEMPVWNVIQRLPQQYVVRVTVGTDGTMRANNTLAQLLSVGQAYGFAAGVIGAASINAIYNGKLYYMSASTPTSMTFTATTGNGLETLTVSNDGKEGSADVWTHEVVPLGSSPDISLGLTSAAIGQTIKVKAIDTDGKPTAWEAVDMAGGDLSWIEVADITTEEQTQKLIISTDKDGRPISQYNALEMIISILFPADATQTSVNGSPWIFPYPKIGESTYRYIASVSVWKTVERTLTYAVAGLPRVPWSSAMTTQTTFGTVDTNGDADFMSGLCVYIQQSGDHIPAGTRVRIAVLSKGVTA